VEAIKNYQIASEEYLTAKAYLKQLKNVDQDSIKTLELLADTNKRKAKLLKIREQNGVEKIKQGLNEKVKEQKQKKRNALMGKDPKESGVQLSESEKQVDIMREPLKIINTGMFYELKAMMETLHQY